MTVSIRLQIKTLYKDLSLKEQAIADYILENPSKVSHSSISDLSNELGIADSTFFQFTKKLGYNGFKDFKMAMLMQENDFSAWQPDAVIVNLGTNDTGAFDNPPWQDPATGKPHQLRRLSNGDFHPADAQKVANGVQHFLTLIRAKNPGAKLVWCIGMLGSELLPVLRQGMEQYKAITGDSSVYLLELPNTTPETVGARQHPGAENHRQAAKTLTAFLRTIL